MESYPNLFKKGKLGRIPTKNRIILAPMGENMATTDGAVSEQALAYYGARAKGGAAVIIPGVVSVEYPRGKTTPCQHRLDDVKYVKDYARLAQEVHRYGSLLLPQIHHAGSSTDLSTTEGLTPVCVSPPKPDAGERVAIASKTDESLGLDANHVLTTEEIKELEGKYIQSAIYAQLAGCDGVEIHGAHGYLISQFLSSNINWRDDEYGGSIENRGRFPVNIVKGIREACGKDFIIGIRMPVHNWETDGLTDEDSITLARMYESAGCDFLNLSGGFTPTITCLLEIQSYPQGARLVLADKIKNKVGIPIMSAGMLREPGFCEEAIADGRIDFAIMGRTLIADPEWGEKAKTGRTSEIRRCISCLDACYGNLAKGKMVQCCINPEVGYESMLQSVNLPETKKNVVIVGGGIAGMQAAITASKRGHNVNLLEKSNKLAGQLNLASVPPNKGYVKWASEWFSGEVERQNINVHFECEASLAKIQGFSPDVVLVATGAEPVSLPIPGIEIGIQAWDLLSGKVELPSSKKVTVIGGGVVGCETALMLAENSCDVTILEMMGDFAQGLEGANKLDMISEFKEKNIEVLCGCCVSEITDEKIKYNKGVDEIDSEVVVLALGQKSCGGEVTAELEAAGIKTMIVGDAKRPAKFFNATQDAFFAALNL